LSAFALNQSQSERPNFLAMKKTKRKANRGNRLPTSRTIRPHIDWEMTIPVLSTAHIKETTLDALAAASPENIALYPEGAFVNICQTEADAFARAPELSPVATWFRKSYPTEHWIRFDRDGDIINKLPTFEW
jgi:hypothetical protein